MDQAPPNPPPEAAREPIMLAPGRRIDQPNRWVDPSRKVIGIGPFLDMSGSLAIFRRREAAEASVNQDPFIA
jgi:hypothetical protein